jgi:PiT family inorganic phosphate transporter
MILALLIIGTLWLAYSNGANDNFKGVATLYGSRTLGYRGALILATTATAAGSLTSIAVAKGLVKSFSGKGIVAEQLLNDQVLVAVALAAATTILLATLIGMPTSTTHALVGALVGAGLMASPGGINGQTLLAKFAQPLLLSPLLAIGLTACFYPILRRCRRRLGIRSESCVCAGERIELNASHGAVAFTAAPVIAGIEFGTKPECVERYVGSVIGIDVQQLVNVLHAISAGAVCFARAVNDTPKIAALLLSAQVLQPGLSPYWVLVGVTVAMLIGGVVQSRKIAETMSRRITELNTGQGLTANLITAALVLGASRIGVPVSTTHVSCGTIFGVGAVNGARDWRTIRRILLTWVTTLPLGLLLGAAIYWAISG